MNKNQYIINLLLKDNNISAKIKNLQVNFNTLNSSVNKVNQTINSVSADIAKNLTGVNKDATSVHKRIEQTSNNIKDQAQMANFQTIAIVTRNMMDSFKSFSAAGVNFNQSMADLSSITGIAGKDLKNLGRIARQTGKESGLGATEAAQAFALLASQIQVDKIGMEGLKTLQKETITLAQAAGTGVSDAATALTTTINQFGLQATEANRVINVLAAGSKYGAAQITELSQSFKVTGAVAAAAGLSVEQTAGALEVLSKSNIKGAEAGTALRNILVKMQTQLGVNFNETGLSSALEALKPQLTDATYLSKLFGAENLEAAQFLITNAAAVDEMTAAVTQTSVAQEQASIQTDTTANKMKQIQATIDDLKISFFDFTGGLSGYVSAFGDSAVMLSQMIPLLHSLKSVFLLVATASGRTQIVIAAKTTVLMAATVATKLLTGAQIALNAVMRANPIAIVVLAVTGLVAGLGVAYNKFEGFKKVVDEAWAGIKKFAFMIGDKFVKAFEAISAVLSPLWNKLKILFGGEQKVEVSTNKASESVNELGESGKNLNTVLLDNSLTLEELLQKIKTLKKEQLTASSERFLAIQQEIGLLQERVKLMKGEGTNTNLESIGGVQQKIEDLNNSLLQASGEQAVAIQKEINLWEQKLKVMKNALIVAAADPPPLQQILPSKIEQIDLQKAGVEDIHTTFEHKLPLQTEQPNEYIKQIVKGRQEVRSFNDMIWGSNSLIKNWADNATAGTTRLVTMFGEFDSMLKDKSLGSIQKACGGLQAMGAIMNNLGNSIGEIAGKWLNWGSNLLATIAQAVPAILSMIGVTKADTLVTNENANSHLKAGAAKALNASAGLGPFGWIAGIAAVGAIVGAMTAIPKMADGAIVYGNTLAQVGEYPGAAHNPEVIAPLSKLRSLIQPADSIGGTLEFKIRGRDLYAVLKKAENLNDRTR